MSQDNFTALGLSGESDSSAQIRNISVAAAHRRFSEGVAIMIKAAQVIAVQSPEEAALKLGIHLRDLEKIAVLSDHQICDLTRKIRNVGIKIGKGVSFEDLLKEDPMAALKLELRSIGEFREHSLHVQTGSYV